MRASTAEKIGSENVYHTLAEIPKDFFDTLVSSLVICVVKKDDLDEIMTIMTDSLKKGGVAYFGFCNPEDFAVEDTKLQHRHTTGCSYEEEHEYKKTIREGEFTITEQHRPIPFYEALFRRYGYSVLDKKYSTPEHIDGVECSDFVMYTLRKED